MTQWISELQTPDPVPFDHGVTSSPGSPPPRRRDSSPPSPGLCRRGYASAGPPRRSGAQAQVGTSPAQGK